MWWPFKALFKLRRNVFTKASITVQKFWELKIEMATIFLSNWFSNTRSDLKCYWKGEVGFASKTRVNNHIYRLWWSVFDNVSIWHSRAHQGMTYRCRQNDTEPFPEVDQYRFYDCNMSRLRGKLFMLRSDGWTHPNFISINWEGSLCYDVSWSVYGIRALNYLAWST